MALPVGWSTEALEKGTPPSPAVATGTDFVWGGNICPITDLGDAVG